MWGLSRLCIDDQESDAESLREMRAGVHPGAGVGRSWLLRTIFPQMGSRSANSEQPCAVQRDCVGLLPFSSLQRAARWPPCVQERVGMTALCVRQGVQGSRQVCAERWKDSSCSCCRGDQETARLRPAHRGHCSRAAGTEAQIRQPH